MPSTVEPYRAQVEQLLAAGVEQMTIFDRLRERGYPGSYSSIRRFVRTLQPARSNAVVRVHAAPGEEAQVDFGSAGMLLDPIGSRPRRAWIFVKWRAHGCQRMRHIVTEQSVELGVCSKRPHPLE
jgi:hypothetical protein